MPRGLHWYRCLIPALNCNDFLPQGRYQLEVDEPAPLNYVYLEQGDCEGSTFSRDDGDEQEEGGGGDGGDGGNEPDPPQGGGQQG